MGCYYSAAWWNLVKGTNVQLCLRRHSEQHPEISLTKVKKKLTQKLQTPKALVVMRVTICVFCVADHLIGFRRHVLNLQAWDRFNLKFIPGSSYSWVLSFFSFYKCLTTQQAFISRIYCFVSTYTWNGVDWSVPRMVADVNKWSSCQTLCCGEFFMGMTVRSYVTLGLWGFREQIVSG